MTGLNILNSQSGPNVDLNQKTEEWFLKNPDSFPHWLTPEEENNKGTIERDFYETDPPPGPVINIPEFAPMEGVLIRYPFGISYAVIAEMSENTRVTTIVSSSGQQSYVTNQYNSYGVNLNNCDFLIAPSDSYWTRDYGPWYIIDGNYNLAIVNFPYNRPQRPNDDDIPIRVSEFLEVELYGMDVETAGGNYMTDGMGVSASSTLVFEENSNQTQNQIRSKFEDYLGIYDFDVIEDPNNTYIDHIDCWAKFLDVDKILIRSVPQSHPQYDEIEDVVDYYESQITGYGTSYEIYRVYTPNNQPYTNSIILNEKVLVPITGSSWDDDALDSYEEAMPGYEIVGLTGSWESTDALHCRTKGIPDKDMIYISHIPLQEDIQPIDGSGIEISATLISLDGQNSSDTFAEIRYRFNNSTYQSAQLNYTTGNEFSGLIPSCSGDCEVSYYLVAINADGDIFNHPYIGEADPHIFNMINAEVQISVDYSAAWNLVGNPVTTPENQVDILFPESTENTLYNFGSSGYVSQSELEPGVGYWLHFQNNGTTDISGLPIYEQYLNLMEGWNLISGLSVTISTDQILDPSSILIPNTYYGYQAGAGYVNSDEIHPGKGYWVRTNTEGAILLTNQASRIINFTDQASRADWISINGTKLYLGLFVSERERLSYSLPPKPPENGSDVRFKGDKKYCTDSGIIEIKSNDSILELYFEISNPNQVWKLVDISTNIQTTITGNGHLSIPNSEEFEIYKQLKIPQRFLLHQNFPNPFNPKTMISFEIPSESYTSLDIYDVIGNKIINLQKGIKDAGYHSIYWDGNNIKGKEVPSGIYFYKLSFDKRMITRKMILLN